ncbi:hypothetical protein KIPB_005213 [Kipferlia bialata]|uniref:Calcineurin-like phosphoesterase domain-containing protein n=1 Tax=Kipferlia bialata TaxID=797122 RepID=A0A9K3CWV5_9EUKA|nr:hypothetical protein KIPB_005213 [Kipferlia bialata]|eukprot:g5213.t1
MRVLAVGCVHGHWQRIVDEVNRQQQAGTPVDLILACGDGKTFRSKFDMNYTAIPPRYRNMESFHELYNGGISLPVPCIYIGGNHDASLFLYELPYGGWIAPNVYYLGHASAVDYVLGDRHVRIGGVSGIYKRYDIGKGHNEQPPFDQDALRSVYHHRQSDFTWLQSAMAKQPPLSTICLSHDWPSCMPAAIEPRLLPMRVREEAQAGQLGSDLSNELVNALAQGQIRTLGDVRWYSAHMHFRGDMTIRKEGLGNDVVFVGLGKDMEPNGFEIIEIPDDTCRESLQNLSDSIPDVMPTDKNLFFAACLPVTPDPLTKTCVAEERKWYPVAPFSRRFDPETFRDNPQTVALCDQTGLPLPYNVIDGCDMQMQRGRAVLSARQRARTVDACAFQEALDCCGEGVTYSHFDRLE